MATRTCRLPRGDSLLSPRLRPRSPIAGVALDWDPVQRLSGRTVQQGEELLRIADPGLECTIEARFPDMTLPALAPRPGGVHRGGGGGGLPQCRRIAGADHAAPRPVLAVAALSEVLAAFADADGEVCLWQVADNVLSQQWRASR